LIGIEEPENQLHPRLLPELAEECRAAANSAQLMVTTHSPFFLNAVRAEEAWVLYRSIEGYTEARRVSEMHGIAAFVDNGALLGNLWMEGHFAVGDPLTNSGADNRLSQ
jgi:predicted ATPase